MNVIRIDNPADERVREYVGIREAHLRAGRTMPEGEGGRGGKGGMGGRGGGGVFIAEGEVVVRTLIASAYAVKSVLCTPGRLETMGDALERAHAPVYVAELDVLSAVAGFHVHRGLLAVGIGGPEPAVDELLAGASLVVVLEDLSNHDNIGGVFRNAAAFGADAVLLSPRCADPLYRKALRVSVGHVLTVPFARLDPWPGGLGRLRSHGLRVVAMTPGDGSVALAGLDRSPGPIALMVGAEGPGLSRGALETADVRVRIPIRSGVDSLNVATATGIALHWMGGGGRLEA